MPRSDPWHEEAGIEDILLTAPPGCGKTHHLAHYIHGLVARRLVAAPQQVLAMTFSTKATHNLRARISEVAGPVERRRIHVVNFHGVGYRLYRAHAATLGLNPNALLPQPGWLARHRSAIAADYHANPWDLRDQIDAAKDGAFNQEQALDELESGAGMAGRAYEEGLRAADRLDHIDAIRHALCLLNIPEIARLYQCRIPVVVVDECQDLTRSQFLMASKLSGRALVLAGDQAQGIYRFARADPAWVYEQMELRNPRRKTLTVSYRSSPAVLRVVSAIATELGGVLLESAYPDNWPDGGRAATQAFPDTRTEAAALLGHIQADLASDPSATVAVMARAGYRRSDLESVARADGIAFELWDHPVHRPRVVQLLRQHLARACAAHPGDPERLQELYNLCFGACDADDIETIDELNEAFETIEDLIATQTLEQVVGDIRTAGDPDQPVSPGLHFLTGHSGKGQQFDHVYVIGLEEGILPDWRARTAEELGDELAALHVMVSRARTSVTISRCDDVRRDPAKPWLRPPSRWWALLEAACI